MAIKGVCVDRPYAGDRIAQAAGYLGIRKRKGCGCNRRQRKLNLVDAKLRQAYRRFGRWLAGLPQSPNPSSAGPAGVAPGETPPALRR